MKNSITELVFILDKSGSMAGKEQDTIGGFNSMIEKQKNTEGKTYVSTVLFSNQSTVLHDRKDLNEIEPITEKDYFVDGCTALLDAIGGAIHHISNIHKYDREEDVPEHTLFVITTDGMENASREYTYDKVKEMIKQKEECGWEFLFVAANIDAAATAERMGICCDRAANYDVDFSEILYDEMAKTVHLFRMTGKVREGWAEKIDETNKKDK